MKLSKREKEVVSLLKEYGELTIEDIAKEMNLPIHFSYLNKVGNYVRSVRRKANDSNKTKWTIASIPVHGNTKLYWIERKV